MRVWADLFDNHGVYQSTLNGASIAGPVKGMRNISYTPRGIRLNAAGELNFSLLLATRRAVAIDEGAFIRVWEAEDDGVKRDQGLFVVGEGDETDDGTQATFRCPDLMEELRWSLLSGYANNTAFGVDATAADIVRLARDYTHSPAVLPSYWDVRAVPGTTGFYTGTSYVVEANSNLAALVELTNQTGYGFRLAADADRIVEFGDLRGDSGIRLQRGGGDASRGTPSYVRPLMSLAPKRDPQTIITVVVPQAQGVDGVNLRDIWNETGNTILPNTNGDWHLTGPIADDWYDAAFPLVRRPRPDLKSTDGQDGWTYFIVNSDARLTKRERWQSQTFEEVRPASQLFSDRRAAAAALYRACVSFLQERAAAHRVLDITTTAIGDNRGLAGKDVQVIDHKEVDGVVTRDINEFRTVVDCLRSIDDTGLGTDHWTVDNIGRRIRGDRQVIADTWRRMVSLATNPRPVTLTDTTVFSQHVPINSSMFFTILANPIQRRSQVVVHVAPGKDDAGSTPNFVLLLVNGYQFSATDYPTGSDPFDVDLSYVPDSTTQVLGNDSLHDLPCEVAVGAAGNITVTVTIRYTGTR